MTVRLTVHKDVKAGGSAGSEVGRVECPTLGMQVCGEIGTAVQLGKTEYSIIHSLNRERSVPIIGEADHEKDEITDYTASTDHNTRDFYARIFTPAPAGY